MTDTKTVQKLEQFLTRNQIQQRVEQLGAEINREFAGQTIVLVGVLKGAAIFLADLARTISIDCTLDFVTVSSYGANQHSSEIVCLVKSVDQKVEGKNVILVDDILDTGLTLSYVKNLLLTQRPAILKTVTLLDKPSRRLKTFEADYVGFTIPDRFVVGYGMDSDERYRNLPDIYFMPSIIQ